MLSCHRRGKQRRYHREIEKHIHAYSHVPSVTQLPHRIHPKINEANIY